MKEQGKEESEQQEQKPNRVQVSTVDEYLAEIKGALSGDYIYRGQSNSAWPVNAAAIRRIKTPPSELIENLLLSYSVQIVNDVKMRFPIDVKDLSDLEIMAKIQHFKGATGLIDFTADPLTALWFACFENENEDGAVYMLNMAEDIKPIKNYDTVQKKTVKDFFGKNKLWDWRPPNIEARIISQNSWFVFGKATIPPYQFTKILTIKEEDKKPILDALSRLNVTEENLFNDFYGFAEINGSRRTYDHRRLLEYYDEAIKSKPTDAEAYFSRGNVKTALKNYPDAIADYDQAIELNPQLAMAYNNRGFAKAALENYQDAIADYNQAIKLNPQFAMFYYNRGIAKIALENYQDALADYDQAIALDPQDAMAYNNRGTARARLENYEDAIVDFDQAIELDPQQANAYTNRGKAKTALGNYPDAIADCDQAIVLDPQLDMAYYNRGIAKKQSGDKAEAEKDFAKARELEPNLGNTSE